MSDQQNASHLLYEVLTNQNWGMGAPTWLMDTGSFMVLAETLYNESFGLSLKWNQQDKIENFASDILDHIQATIFTNPRTGLFSVKALRDDYDLFGVREINPGNAKLKSFSRKLFGEMSNEIVVSWTNPENEKKQTLTNQNLAAMSIQGAPISDNRDYYAVRSAELAQRLLDRDLRTSSAPLASGEWEVDRRFWDVLPGEVLRVNWPKYNLVNLGMRANVVDYGNKGSSKITLSLFEDVFALDKPNSGPPPSSAWNTTRVDPTPMDNVEIFTLPTFLAAGLVPAGTEPAYPEALAAVLAYKGGPDIVSYDLYTETIAINGQMLYANLGEKSVIGRIALVTPIYQEAVTQMQGFPLADTLRGPKVGSLAFIGTGGDVGMEIALLRAWDANTNMWTLDRGVLDTIPRPWPVGTPVWIVPEDASIADTLEYRSVGETPEYKLLTRTSRGVLTLGAAPTNTGSITARPHAPLRPANVAVNGVAFGEVDATGATQLVVTWSNRNRLFEEGEVMRWTAASVTPEYLQQAIVTIFRENGEVLYYHKGLWTESSFAIPIAWVQEETRIFIRVSSERSGIASIQSFGLWVKNIPQIPNPAAPPASDNGPPPPPPPGTPDDPTPDDPAAPDDPPPENPGSENGGWG